MPLTNKEVFDVYGLIVGMIQAEGKNIFHQGNGNGILNPAQQWARQWQDHPSLEKAHKIYADCVAKISRDYSRQQKNFTRRSRLTERRKPAKELPAHRGNQPSSRLAT